jgi:hypothetical protein
MCWRLGRARCIIFCARPRAAGSVCTAAACSWPSLCSLLCCPVALSPVLKGAGSQTRTVYGGSTISMRRRPASLARWAVCWGRGQASQARVTDGRGVASLLVPRAARRRLAVSLDRSYGATAPDQPAGRPATATPSSRLSLSGLARRTPPYGTNGGANGPSCGSS